MHNIKVNTNSKMKKATSMNTNFDEPKELNSILS